MTNHEDEPDPVPQEKHVVEGEKLKALYGDNLDDLDGIDFAEMDRPSEPEGVGDEYPPDWDEISKLYRASVGYECQVCGLSFEGGSQRLLHVHHLNRIKTDCDPSNLQAECAWCHSDNQGHEHIWEKLSDRDKETIREKRRYRGLHLHR